MNMSGIVLNVGGRVLINSSGDHTQLEGVYVCGWLKKGPTGIIATNLYCAEETIISISEDLEKGVLASAPSLPKPGREGLLQLLDRRNVKVIPFSSWEKIDTEERRLGSLKNKPRDKLTTWEELLKVAAKVIWVGDGYPPISPYAGFRIRFSSHSSKKKKKTNRKPFDANGSNRRRVHNTLGPSSGQRHSHGGGTHCRRQTLVIRGVRIQSCLVVEKEVLGFCTEGSKIKIRTVVESGDGINCVGSRGTPVRMTFAFETVFDELLGLWCQKHREYIDLISSFCSSIYEFEMCNRSVQLMN
ncbi:unnamed protein product [Camellia sinensis]